MRLLLVLVFTLLPASAAFPRPPNVGDVAPDWTLENKEGESVNYYEASEGKVSIVLFWATWCPYCRSLMPHLEVIYQNYRNKGLEFYAIDIFEDGKIDPVEYFEKMQFSFTMLKDGDLVAGDYGVKGTPGLFVVDRDKKIIYRKPVGVSDVLVKQNVDLKVKQALAK
ncbi:MAG TPA: TlpA disulfide reductase family protein [Gammaproteobacteria bacterium]|nr:TlpA disulfide reductase family protein [Gammaproteobacteria bacterium]